MTSRVGEFFCSRAEDFFVEVMQGIGCDAMAGGCY